LQNLINWSSAAAMDLAGFCEGVIQTSTTLRRRLGKAQRNGDPTRAAKFLKQLQTHHQKMQVWLEDNEYQSAPYHGPPIDAFRKEAALAKNAIATVDAQAVVVLKEHRGEHCH
jgi:hypothetical protein